MSISLLTDLVHFDVTEESIHRYAVQFRQSVRVSCLKERIPLMTICLYCNSTTSSSRSFSWRVCHLLVNPGPICLIFNLIWEERKKLGYSISETGVRKSYIIVVVLTLSTRIARSRWESLGLYVAGVPLPQIRALLAVAPTRVQTSGYNFGDCCMTSILPGIVLLTIVIVLLIFLNTTGKSCAFGKGIMWDGGDGVVFGHTSKESI